MGLQREECGIGIAGSPPASRVRLHYEEKHLGEWNY